MNNRGLPDPRLYPQFDFSFKGLKNTFDKYSLEKDTDGNCIAIDRTNGMKITDKLTIDRVKFSIAWIRATEFERSRTTSDTSVVTEQDYEYAFNDGARKTYSIVMNSIQDQLLTTGDIDPIQVVDATKTSTYKYSQSIATGLFSQQKYAQATNDWARHAIPNSLQQTSPVITYEQAVQLTHQSGRRL